MFERPFDFLDSKKGKPILLKMKENGNSDKPVKDLEAVLIAFDIHMNLLIEVKGRTRFVRGDNVIWVE